MSVPPKCNRATMRRHDAAEVNDSPAAAREQGESHGERTRIDYGIAGERCQRRLDVTGNIDGQEIEQVIEKLELDKSLADQDEPKKIYKKRQPPEAALFLFGKALHMVIAVRFRVGEVQRGPWRSQVRRHHRPDQ